MTTFTAMPKYEAYKDSGVDWIGFVPDSWEISRLGAVFEERRVKVSDMDYPPLSVTKSGILPQLDSAAKTKDGDNRKQVLTGDFVINSRSDRKGSSGVSSLDGSVSLINIVLKPKRINPSFCNHLLKCNAFIEEYYRVGRGIVADLWTTRYDEMRTMMLALPSSEEQTAIATFLDEKTAKIDEAIAIKEKQIELLKERKQIIIQQAVTQGLDSTVPMKDSGVEWIGKIPAHWDIRRGKFLFKKMSRPVRKDDDVVTCFRDGQVTLRTNRRTEGFTFALKEHGYQGVRVGDLVIHAMDAFAGAIGVSDSDGKSTPVYSVCTPVDVTEIFPSYYAYYLRNLALTGFIESLAKGIRERSTDFRFNDFSELFLPLPPKSIQQAIVSYIDSELEKADAGISHLFKQIEKIKEYKTTLINSAVTGKIKVV